MESSFEPLSRVVTKNRVVMMSRKENKRGRWAGKPALASSCTEGGRLMMVWTKDDDVGGKKKLTFERVGDALIDLFHVTQW